MSNPVWRVYYRLLILSTYVGLTFTVFYERHSRDEHLQFCFQLCADLKMDKLSHERRKRLICTYWRYTVVNKTKRLRQGAGGSVHPTGSLTQLVKNSPHSSVSAGSHWVLSWLEKNLQLLFNKPVCAGCLRRLYTRQWRQIYTPLVKHGLISWRQQR